LARVKLTILYVLFFSSILSAQGPGPDEEPENRPKNPVEYVMGYQMNTNGGILGGGYLRLGFRKNDKKVHLAGLELINVKHTKEERASSIITGNSFIPGKINYLFSLRPQYGQEILLFEKYPEEGIRLTAIFAGGPSFGLLKPYYIEYDFTDYSDSSPSPDIRREPFDPNVHFRYNRILGSGGFFNGLGQTEVKMGIHGKIGLDFELSRSQYDRSVTGIETGFIFELFPDGVDLFPTQNGNSFFSAVFINFYFGKR
jgi:hypothetical protein